MKKNIILAVLVLAGSSLATYAQTKVAGIWVQSNGYINWGNLRRDVGYGLRDNAGTIEIKNLNDIGWTNLGAAGNPGGSSGQIQYNNGANFGGIPIAWNGTRLLSTITNTDFLWLQPGSNPTTQNGYFQFHVGRSANGMPDPRADDGFQMGWNIDGACTGCGGAQLSFESHCSDATGCLDGIGQSETYFQVTNGNGTNYRPIGMFQSANQTAGMDFVQGFFNFSTLYFMDQGQNNMIMSLSSDDDGPGDINFGDNTILRASVTARDFLRLNGVPVISVGKNSQPGIVIGADGNSVALAPGGDGSAVVGVYSNNFQLATGNIYDSSAAHRISLQSGSDVYYPSMAIGANTIGLKPAGSGTNIGTTISSKGNAQLTIDATDAGTGNIVIQAIGAGGSEIFLRTNNLGVWDGSQERYGASGNGTSCTITRVSKGIVTAVTCS